ncbi:Protein MAIN-LIKE 2 [Glycine soja]
MLFSRSASELGKSLCLRLLVGSSSATPPLTTSFVGIEDLRLRFLVSPPRNDCIIMVITRGEVTITLDDVASLLHLLIIGAFHSFDTFYVDKVVLILVELLKVTGDEARAETVQCQGAYVHLSWLREIYHSCTIFANKSATHVHVVFLNAFRDLSQSGSYTWGIVVLVHMYDNLNDACKSGGKQLAGYITCWIYKCFPSIVEAFTDSYYNERSPRAWRWTSTKALPASTYHKHLDRLTTVDVCWMPYGDHRAVWEFDLISCFSGHIRWGPIVVIHRLEKVVRQFGQFLHAVRVQDCASKTLTINGCISLTTLHRWARFVGQCAHDYMEWFYLISHPFMRPTQPGDPPRHPLVMQDGTFVEPDIPEIPVALASVEEAPAQAPSDVEQPRHAVDACQAIAERLERLLNLRIVTEAHNVMQDCIQIARGVTVDGNVYVRSQ